MFSLSVFSNVYSEEYDDRSVKPLNGELVLPNDYNNPDDKKCLTVCKKWGKDCILRQKGSEVTGGGYERKCRRVCKSFAEECFFESTLE